MARPRRAPAATQFRYPRTARLNESLREVIAEELTRIDDERLALVTVTAIDVDPEMNRATVFFDSLAGVDGDPEILEAFAEHRVRLQGSIGKQVRAKKTPILQFKPDEVIRAAERIDRIIAENPVRPIGDDPPEANPPEAEATDDAPSD
jgi:ribosome-binding factor A